MKTKKSAYEIEISTCRRKGWTAASTGRGVKVWALIGGWGKLDAAKDSPSAGKRHWVRATVRSYKTSAAPGEWLVCVRLTKKIGRHLTATPSRISLSKTKPKTISAGMTPTEYHDRASK